MKHKFRGWDEVAQHLRAMASPLSSYASLLNDGQRASLAAIADRIGNNGVIIADEVGMGKTRIAVFVAKAVEQSGGRAAVVIPPGLSFQWKKEFRDCGTAVPDVLRSLQRYFEAWGNDDPTTVPWFRQPIVMISHLFSNWKLRQDSRTWRWCLLPEVYAAINREIKGRVPRGYHDAYDRDDYVQRVVAAADSITQSRPSEAKSAAHRLFKDLPSEVSWRVLIAPENYRKTQSLRASLEKIIGIGLGSFDLIIVDEAHKNRSEDGGLSTVLRNVIQKGNECRRLALTATPIELDVSQWESTLKRLSTTKEQRDPIVKATERYAQAIRRLRLSWRTNGAVRDEYREAAMQFAGALSPYLLRRDKRQDEDVIAFEAASGQSGYNYRHLKVVPVEFKNLPPPWCQAVCAAEALSVLREPATNARAKRLRLTIGNGHGIASVIDEAFRDEDADRKQIEEELRRAKDDEETSDPAENTDPPVGSRSKWWASVLRDALTNDRDFLYDHPAILAAVKIIEEETERGEKVLVFGRFTRPMRDLVSLLNARQMLKAIEHKRPWPQSKVHVSRDRPEFDEWPAVHAAHRQLSSKLDLAKLDGILVKRYKRESRQRKAQRDDLLARLREAIAGEPASAKYLAILAAIERSSAATIRKSDDDEHHIALLARAIDANIEHPSASHADLASAFRALVDAAGDHDSSDDEELDDEQAENAWNELEQHLRESYTSQRGGFARLMYGETKPQTRRMIQLAFNRSNSFPHVLVAQSLVGREGLNLHESCRIVVLLHPEWNPAVVEQQIGRIDRVNSRWAKELRSAISDGRLGDDLPRIEIRPIIFKGTYDEQNWNVLQERWDDLRAQLHGEAIPRRLREGADVEGLEILGEITAARPDFSPR